MSQAIGGGDGEVYRNGNHHGGGVHSIGRRIRRSNRRSRDSGGGSDPRAPQPRQEKDKAPIPCTDFDVAYFHSYAHLGIHEEMIKDRVRTETYRNAIFQHQDRIEGKVVVDVGCGTGILSIFCAQAGARRVYAVDASNIAVQANEVVKANNLADTITVLHGRVEDVEIDEEVDVIISEWMGYMLLYESMLGSVISARDRWLKPGGLILPSNATLYMAPVSHPCRYGESVDFWRNVYGIDRSGSPSHRDVEEVDFPLTLSRDELTVDVVGKVHFPFLQATLSFLMNDPALPIQILLSSESLETRQVSVVMPLAKQCAFEEPSVELISGENVLTWPNVVKHVDCSTVTIHELERVSTKFKFASMMRAPFHGFAFWFDVEFGAPAMSSCDNIEQSASVETPDGRVTDSSQKKKRSNPNDTLVLSTSPEEAPTHWQQTLVYFYDPIEVEQDQLIEGSVTLSQSKENPRFMNIHLEYASNGCFFVKESVMR